MERVTRTPAPNRPAKAISPANGAYTPIAVRTLTSPMPSPRVRAKANGRAKGPSTTPEPPSHVEGSTHTTPIDRYRMIATAAYYLAEKRQFEAGHELEDWCAAECQVDKILGIRPPEGLQKSLS